MGYIEDASKWVKENQLKAIGGLWVSGLAASVAYQWSQDIPRSLKVIHSRVYAQALTLGALACVAVAEHYDHKSTTSEEMHNYKKRMADLEAKMELQHAREHQADASLGKATLHHHHNG